MNTERRIARVSRHVARAVIELEAAGEIAGAAKLRDVAVEVVEQMRFRAHVDEQFAAAQGFEKRVSAKE